MSRAGDCHRQKPGPAGGSIMMVVVAGLGMALATPVPAQVDAASPQVPLARLRTDLDALYRALPRPNNAEEWRPFEETRAQWRRRLARCGDDRCRRANLEEQIARLRYGNGETRRPLAGLPWPHGRFMRTAPGESLRVSVYPLIDDRILVHVTGLAMPTGRWVCDATAVGPAAGAAPFRLRVIAEEPAELRVTPRGHAELSIAYDFDHRIVCGLDGAIDGRYQLEPVRQARIGPT